MSLQTCTRSILWGVANIFWYILCSLCHYLTMAVAVEDVTLSAGVPLACNKCLMNMWDTNSCSSHRARWWWPRPPSCCPPAHWVWTRAAISTRVRTRDFSGLFNDNVLLLNGWMRPMVWEATKVHSLMVSQIKEICLHKIILLIWAAKETRGVNAVLTLFYFDHVCCSYCQ